MSRDAAYLAEIRPGWRRIWLQHIAEFSDLELQRRTWLGGPNYASPYWSFDEWICRYFDDSALSFGYSEIVAEGLVSQEEADAVSAFHAAADVYKPPTRNSADHPAILGDPKWLRVVALAEEARLQLLGMITVPEERAVLERK